MHHEQLGKKLRPEDEQSTCVTDQSDGELSHLRRYFYSPTLMRSRLYEQIYHHTINHIRESQSMAIAICLLCMALSQMEEVKAQGKLSEEGMWREQVQKLRQILLATEKECNCNKEHHFLKVMNSKGGLNELKKQYERFLDAQSQLIYKTSERIWRLLQLYAFAQTIPQTILTEFEVDQYLSTFTLQLAQRENQIRLQLHIQSCILQPEQTGVKQMMKVESYLPKEKQSLPTAYPPNFTVKQMMLLEISMDTISLVERCEAHECPYMLFCLPFLYLLAETLSYYCNPLSLFIYRIFITLVARVNKVKNSSNPQLSPSEIDQCLMDVLNFSKLAPNQLCLRAGKFLERHSGKMSTFIPVYYHIFNFHAFQKYPFVEQLFNKKGSISERRKKMKERMQEVFDYCQKYNNDSL